MWPPTCSLLCSGITTTDDGQRFVPEDRNRTVANGTCADATLPIGIFALETHTLRTCTGCDDDGVGRLSLLVFLALTPVTERTCRKVDTGNSLGDNRRAEPDRLRTELIHKFGAKDPPWEAGEVLDWKSLAKSGAVRVTS